MRVLILPQENMTTKNILKHLLNNDTTMRTMAEERVNECSSKIDSISLLNLSEAENLFEERKCTNRNDILPSNCKLKLHWSGDFTSLRHFVCNVIKLHGSWSQPGGDKKVFSGDSFSII